MADPADQDENLSHHCPQCGQKVPVGKDKCPACGKALCPACGASVGARWTVCLACGVRRDQVCPACGAPIKARHRRCPQCGAQLDKVEGTSPTAPLPAPPAEALPSLTSASIPSCGVCGRQDETLRMAVFPYVFSVVFVTFRRAFAGVWCSRHQNRYRFLAGLITSAVGWLGIPFGLIYTPSTLFKLARGGEPLQERNRHLLQVLAGHKLRVGDAQGASRCLEEALRLGDDEPGRRRLRELYEEYHVGSQPEPQRRLWPLLVSILGAAAMGIAIGLLDYGATAGFSALTGEEGSLFIGLLSWVPFVALLYLGGLGVAQWVEWGLRRSRDRQKALGITFGLVVAGVAAYGTQQGEFLGDYLAASLAGEWLPTVWDELHTVWLGLTVGPISVLADQVQFGGIPAIIYLSLFALTLVYYGVMGVGAARGMVRWHEALDAVRAGGAASRVPALQVGWLAILATLLCALVSVGSLLLLEGGGAETDSALAIQQALDLQAQGLLDESIAELEALREAEPDSVPLHYFLGSAYLDRGEFAKAAQALEHTLELQPEPELGIVHAMLGYVYFQMDRADLMWQELQQAEALSAEDPSTLMIVGDTYREARGFAEATTRYLQAVELAPELAAAYLRLAGAYAVQGQYDLALATCDQALELEANAAEVHMARGGIFVQQEDLEQARESLLKALALAPEDSEAHAALSQIYLLQGEFDASLREAEEATRLDPYSRNGQHSLALAYHALGELDPALAAALEAVRLAPKRDISHYALALCHRDLGEQEKAIQEFETFLGLYWERPYARAWRAEAEAYLAEAQ